MGPILKPLGLYDIEVTLKLHASGIIIVRKWLVVAHLPGSGNWRYNLLVRKGMTKKPRISNSDEE